jgi:multidrug efflux pump
MPSAGVIVIILCWRRSSRVSRSADHHAHRPLSIFGALVPSISASLRSTSTRGGSDTLVGLITKHGILMVEFANAQREHGLSRHDAIVEAARVRLRPILMTTAAMVLGVAPLLIASGGGEGALLHRLVIAAGMAIGTLFTLFVLPMFYTFIAHRDAPREARRELDEAVAMPAE